MKKMFDVLKALVKIFSFIPFFGRKLDLKIIICPRLEESQENFNSVFGADIFRFLSNDQYSQSVLPLK